MHKANHELDEATHATPCEADRWPDGTRPYVAPQLRELGTLKGATHSSVVGKTNDGQVELTRY